MKDPIAGITREPYVHFAHPQKCHLVIPHHLGNKLRVKALLPEWFRVRVAADYSGISQTELWRLCIDGEIESVHRLKPGQAKGIRLINRQSLDAYVRSFLPGGARYRPTPPEIRVQVLKNSKGHAQPTLGKEAGS